MGTKKPQWRMYLFPNTVDSNLITKEPGHVMYKHMTSGITLKVPVGPGFMVTEMGITTTMNQANQFLSKNEDEIIQKYGLIPPMICNSQLQNYDDFMLAHKDKTITKPKGVTQ